MKLKACLIGLTMGLALCQIGVVYAADKTDPVVKADNKDDFTAVAAAIRQQIAPGGRWQSTSKTEKGEIDQRLGEMQSIFDRYGTLAQMDAGSKSQVLTDQQDINAILTKRDDDRLVCEDESRTGTLIKHRVCRTYGQMRLDRQNAEDYMRLQSATPQLRGGGG
ncbi:MAG: hypothetical protein ABI132_00865 [Rhodanobacteraceae bacterium]